jgi:hypothetical protein
MTARRGGVLIVAALVSLAWCRAAEQITLESLVREALDRDAAARFPEPAYTCAQHSSYDRATKTPDDPRGWFANNDQSQFIRKEQRGGRTEEVMFDAAGPGAIVRLWITHGGPVGTVRLYIDDMENPAFEGTVEQFSSGPLLAPKPWAEERAKGRNMYLPIPYAKQGKLTFERTAKGPFYYQVNFRTYAANTPVESFSKAALERAKGLIEETGQKLLDNEASLKEGKDSAAAITISGNGEGKSAISGPAAIRKIAVKVEAGDMKEALRAIVLKLTFDGETTAECPLGDFFGSGVGANAYQSWWNKVETDGTLSCYWVMPFAKQAEIALKYYGKQDGVKAALSYRASDWKWDDRAMLFHATRRMVPEVDSAQKADFNYMTAEGQGVYMGDALMVANPVRDWWGEGDEKVFVDGETFPSHIGTGTEDYYGYAWCTPKYFTSPFHAQPICQGPGNAGHTTNTRVRILDGIPFTKSLKFDMEVWHWKACKITYASCAWWYGKPGAKSNHPFDPETLIVTMPEGPAVAKAKGALEAEEMQIVGQPAGKCEVQRGHPCGWSGDAQVWWMDAPVGSKLSVKFKVEKAGSQKIEVALTRANDYGIVQLYVDDKKLGDPVDCFIPQGVKVAPAEFGPVELTAGEHTLTAELTGVNEKAAKRNMFGLDFIRLKP